MSKSHVSLEQQMCCVTGKTFDTGSLLLDKRMQDSLEKYTTTGWGICPEAQAQIDKGFIAIVGINPDKSEQPFNPDTVYRTGELAYLRRKVAKDLFSNSMKIGNEPFIFAESGIFKFLQEQLDISEGKEGAGE